MDGVGLSRWNTLRSGHMCRHYLKLLDREGLQFLYVKVAVFRKRSKSVAWPSSLGDDTASNARHTATVLGLCMWTGEILGGVLAPFVAGIAADRAGLAAPLLIMVGLALCGGLLALGLRETAPRVLARRARAVSGLALPEPLSKPQ